MKKIAIIGSPGAGKTTLAKHLDPILKIKAYHLDRMFWKRHWKGKDREERIDILQKIVPERQWIIEGTYLKSSEPRLKEADTIIFLDFSPLVCLLRIIKRHLEDHEHSRRDIPQECTDRLTLLRILKVLVFPLRERRQLEKRLREFPSEKVIRLKSVKDVQDFSAQPELFVREKRQSAKAPSVLEQSLNISSSSQDATFWAQSLMHVQP